MKQDISEFVSKCLICQQVKAEHQVSSGLLQPVMIPEWKWDRVTMDFVSGLPLSPKKKDVIWVVVDRLTKSAHFIPVRTDFSLDKLAKLYISKIVRLHGVPYLLFRIEIQDLLHDFGRNCKKLWVQSCILALRFIHKRMVHLNELFRYLRIC